MWPHLFPLYASQLFKTILANGIFWNILCHKDSVISVLPCVTLLYRYTGNCDLTHVFYSG